MPKLLLNTPDTFKVGELVLKLTKVNDGSVDLIAEDRPGGSRWFLLNIAEDGRVGRYGCIYNELGLKLNARGKLKLDKTFQG